ncbi:Transient receptor potential cation channel trpm [Trichinella pseudospiralis]|uniref:Transient receptor potential cation channel trpm n=2 Tax=Trichinella pseudospiralis TaxID=6337 RepID=A0A0V1HZZ8_TRIPS|nr:Transient receptor potential cation channel trpm [Trichinella pseudospiralis]KRZ35486.1 Transient receptor potential cation channel trpm [Trichinella pseudospiralis]
MISRRQKAANQVNEWIRERFLKRECFKILPVSTDSEKCGCGRYFASHYYFEEEKDSAAQKEGNRWSVAECTSTFSTDAYGTLRFQGVSRPWKSLYIRMDFTVDPQDMWQLLVHVWGLEPPKLVITIYGGGNDFELNPALWQEFKNGLLKVAKNTSAWIITSGLRVGVVKHVAAALTECTSTKKKQQFALIGIAPWGMVRQSEQLIGQNKCVNYYPFESQRSRFVSLCEGHTCFLMVDNGTVGRSGAEMTVRRHFETFLKQKSMDTSQRLMPIVCLVLGGGRLALHSAVNFVCSSPPVPVVVCKNSGRGADILAYAVEMATESKLKDENLKKLLCDKIKEKLDLEKGEITWWASCLVDCLAHRNLLTVFDGMSVQDDDQQLDCKILNALLTGRNSTSIDRLSLLLTWNREDMLREILERGGDWEESALHSVMMQALMYDHTDFVKLLLQHGVAVDAFLTPDRLEELYNTDKGPPNTLAALMQDVAKEGDRCKYFRLPDIGLLIETLVGGGFRANYRRREFRLRYKQYVRGDWTHLPQHPGKDALKANGNDQKENSPVKVGSYFFQNPFHDLFIWAVLTNRLEMALSMWQNGDELLAKALIGHKLFKAMAKEAKDDALEMEICDSLRSNAEEFRKLSCELLDQCYKNDDFNTMQLLTYELKNWGKKNCISLAALANNKEFIAHPSCQLLLADLWLGGMRIRKNVNIKVLLGVLVPPLIFTIPFKTKEELLLQAQTAAEYQEHCDVGNLTSDSESSDSDSEDDACCTVVLGEETENNLEQQTENAPRPSVKRKRKVSHYIPSPHYPDMQSVEQQQKKHRGTMPHNGYFAKISPTNDPLEFLNDAASSMPNLSPRGTALYSLKLANLNRQNLSVRKKIREFYAAPITAFWSWTVRLIGTFGKSSILHCMPFEFKLGYLFFLALFTCIVLVKPTKEPYWAEYYILMFVVGFFTDLIRKLLMVDAKDLRSKWTVYSRRQWDRASLFASLIFFIGFGLRVHSNTLDLGRVILKCIIVFYYLRLLTVLTVSSKLGPYITIYGKMVRCWNYCIMLLAAIVLANFTILKVSKMVLLCTILFILLISFGVFRQSLTFPNEEWDWKLIRDIVYKPYFMLYGEVYADEIDTCGDENENCVFFYWLSPLFMTIYLLLSIIVFLNMMIAAFNFVFVTISAHSHLIWKFQKFEQVMDYEKQPFLPPPFVIIVHLYLLVQFLCRRRSKAHRTDMSLKLFLSESDVAKVHDFENQCMEELFERRRQEISSTPRAALRDLMDKILSTNEQIRKLQERLDQYNGRLALIERLIVKVSPEVEVQVQPPSTRSNDSPSPNAERLTISTENVSSVQAAGSKPSGHSQTPGPRLRRHNTCWQTEMAFGISPSSSQRGSPERQLPPRRGNSLIINVRSANDAGNNDQTQRSTTARV